VSPLGGVDWRSMDSRQLARVCSISFWTSVGSERRTDEEVSALTEETSVAMTPSVTKYLFTVTSYSALACNR
jgi:hypothetical protein